MADDWQPIETVPRDASVIVRVAPSPDNHHFATWPPQAHPAYIDEDGNVCNHETMMPDNGLFGQFWTTTHWQHFPSAEVPA